MAAPAPVLPGRPPYTLAAIVLEKRLNAGPEGSEEFSIPNWSDSVTPSLVARLIIIDDGASGALQDLLDQELPETLALVTSERIRPAGIRPGVWVSPSRLRELLPSHGPVRIRVSADQDWQLEADSDVLRRLLPPAEPSVALAVALQVLGKEAPKSIPDDRVLEAWRSAVRAWKAQDLEAAREAITVVNRRWPTWSPGWAFADEVYTSLGNFHVALACRSRAGEPPVIRMRRQRVERKAA